ncbi:hypothetical protein [Bacillus alkalicellulosilyticus]|uniref:hypothetical protein n=1 Tax=Alkalihalobacterium alkalicellulosilyticum TaxID=1912214 RepID=UPI0009976247|nr:hypothetical protein [Bacillus alkalicellulosilyticus]
MNNTKMIFLCSFVNFKKWIINPRIYAIFAIIVSFLAYHLYGLSQFAAEHNMFVSPWLFTHIFSHPLLIVVFSCFIMLLYCDAPFVDRHTPFLAIRTGRRNWVMGQLLYIIISAFVFTMFIYVVSNVVLFPNIRWTLEWGTVLQTLVHNPEAAGFSVFIDEQILSSFSPIGATMLAIFFFWLVAIFIGVLIFCFNLTIGKMSGLVATALFICLSYFTNYLGYVTFGQAILYFSPLNWMSISYLDWDYTGNIPSPTYASLVLLGLIALLSMISVIVACKKDMNIMEWGN